MNQCSTGTGWHRKHCPGQEAPMSMQLMHMELVVSLSRRGSVAGGSELADEALNLKQQLGEVG